MGAALKPNVSGVVFEMHWLEETVIANVDPDRPGAWQRGAPKRLIAEMLRDGFTVWAVVGKDKNLLLPPHETERSAWARAEKIGERMGWRQQATQPTSPP